MRTGNCWWSIMGAMKLFMSSTGGGEGFINSGHFFSSDKRNASGYGEKIYGVYLNLRTPLMVDAQGTNFSSIVYGGVTQTLPDMEEHSGKKSGRRAIIWLYNNKVVFLQKIILWL